MVLWYKKPRTILLSTILFIAIVSITYWYLPDVVEPATLEILAGSVMVDRGDGYRQAANGMELEEHDWIKTGEKSRAVVVLYESSVLRLTPGTEIELSGLSEEEQSINQTSGTVWSKIARIGGLTSYEIITPATTATVRGTGFRSTVAEDGETELLVYDGTVEARNPKERRQLTKRMKIRAARQAFREAVLSEEDSAAIRESLQDDVRVMRRMRERKALKNRMRMRIAERRLRMTDAEIRERMQRIDDGQATDERLERMPRRLRRIQQYSQEIRKQQELLQEYGGMQ